MKCYNSMQSFGLLRNALESSERVFFTRFGDNDIMMMTGFDARRQPLGNRPMGGNRTIHTIPLQIEMLESFKIQDDNYLKAASTSWNKEPGMVDGFHAPFKHSPVLINMIRTITTETKFLLPVLFQYTIVIYPKIFDNFVNTYIRPHEKLFIGCVDQSKAEKIIGKIDHYVNVPPTNAYASINSWWEQVERKLDKDIKVIIPAAGQASRIIQKRLWATGRNFWSFDMGSIFDAFDKPSRTWLKLKGDVIRSRYG